MSTTDPHKQWRLDIIALVEEYGYAADGETGDRRERDRLQNAIWDRLLERDHPARLMAQCPGAQDV